MLKLLTLPLLALAIFTCLPIQDVFAASSVGRIVHAYGPAWVERGNQRDKVEKGQMVFKHDSVITGPRARVKIIMGDGSKVYVGSKSRVSLRQYTMQGNNLVSATINMLWGKARFFVNKLASKRSSFRVRTPTAVLGVRGTEFIVSVPPTPEILSRAFDRLTLADMPALPTRTVLMEGSVNVNTNTGASMLLTPGNTANIDANNRLNIKKTTRQDIDDHQQQTDNQSKLENKKSENKSSENKQGENKQTDNKQDKKTTEPNEQKSKADNNQQGESKQKQPKQQTQKEKPTPQNPKPADAKGIMLDDTPEADAQAPAAMPTPPSLGKAQPVQNLAGDVQAEQTNTNKPAPTPPVTMPTVDSNATNNAIQNLGVRTDVTLQPGFVKP